jgi:RimJ/RimL family protein N-acetyltransferase
MNLRFAPMLARAGRALPSSASCRYPPIMLEPLLLQGEHVRLEPLRAEHREEMRDTLGSDPGNWELQSVSALGPHFEAYWRMMTETPRRITLVAFDQANGRMAGTSSFFDIDPQHRTLEIGYTWFRPEFRGTPINAETKLLMLGQAFDAGVLRVQFSVSAANARSQAAVLKLGATKEGVLRSHKITWTGAHRDTVLFSILAGEWEAVREGLERRLGR